MRVLNGSEIAGFVKERQAHQVRGLRQAHNVAPKLAIVRTSSDPVIDIYVRLKKTYGEDIGVEVQVNDCTDDDLMECIDKLNQDQTVHGIIVQLPLQNPDQTEKAINQVDINKDVDGLCDNSPFTPATAMAIDWLLAGYNVNLDEKKIVIIGKGRLVGEPLYRIWSEAGYDITVCDRSTDDLKAAVSRADIIVTAAGAPNLINSDMIKHGAVVVDAGTATDSGKVVGDLSDDVRARDDLTITPEKGGVGPLTVTALFDNVITAARRSAGIK